MMDTLYPWQSASWQRLQNLRGRLPNALLLKGAEGIGKLHLANYFARSLLCQDPDRAPCGNCDDCHWFQQGNHPDFHLVQPKIMEEEEEQEEQDAENKKKKRPSREITVEQIRDLADFANMSSYRGGYRIVTIYPAEAMNIFAANSLLKTLEEPGDKLLFILVSHKAQQLLPTVISRCLSIPIPVPSPETSLSWLKLNGIEQAEQILALSGFAPLLARHWAEAGEGATERKLLQQALSQPTTLDPISTAEALQHGAPHLLVHALQQWCYDLVSIRLAGIVRYYPQESSTLQKLANAVPLFSLLRLQKELQEARGIALHPLNRSLFLESLLISYRQLFQ